MRKITILKNNNKKYSFQIIDNKVIQYTSEYIYDDVFSLENKLSDYLQEDLLLVNKNGLYGIFDCWNKELLLPILYKNIEVIQHHDTFLFLCTQINDMIVMHNNIGQKMFNDEYSNLMYIGFFNTNNKYIYLYDKNGSVGALSIDGNIIIKDSTQYSFKYYRRSDNIILETILKVENEEDIILYDIYTANGLLLFSNIDNYEFLKL